MPTYYWVATRDTEWTSASAWSSSSGGSGGAGVPTAGDTAIFNGANDKNGGVRLTAPITGLSALSVTNSYRGVFNFDGHNLSTTGSIGFGAGVILIGTVGVLLSAGTTLLIAGSASTLLNLQAHAGVFTLNSASGITIQNAYLKNIVATGGGVKKASNCFDQGGCSGLTFDHEVSVDIPVQLPEPTNIGDWRSLVEVIQLTGARCDYWNTSQFKVTVGSTVLDFATSSKYKMLDLTVSYDGKELRFSQIATPSHADAEILLDAPVTLEMDLGNGLETFFRGRVRKRTHSGINNAHEVEYSCVGMQNLADEVDFSGRDGMPGDVFPGYAFTTGQIVSQLFTTNATALRSLSIITTLTDPTLPYLNTVVRENTSIEGMGFVSALRNVMKEQPSRKVFFDDTLGSWSFPDLLTAQPYDLNINLAGLDSNVYTLDLTNRYTAVECYAPFSSSGVVAKRAFTELTPDWDVDFEADWTIRRALGLDGADQFGDSYAWVFRRWRFGSTGGNSSQRYKPARMYCLIPWWKEFTWVPIDCFIDWQNGICCTKVPVVVKGNPHAPGDAIGPYAAMLTYNDPTTFPVSNLAFTRVPAVGYEGTAYTKFGLAKTKRQLVDVNQLFDGYARQRLDVLKDVIVTADIPIKGDPIREFINLQCTLRVIDSDRVTGMEDFYGLVVGYKYSFGKPGLNTISITTDKSIVSKATS